MILRQISSSDKNLEKSQNLSTARASFVVGGPNYHHHCHHRNGRGYQFIRRCHRRCCGEEAFPVAISSPLDTDFHRSHHRRRKTAPLYCQVNFFQLQFVLVFLWYERDFLGFSDVNDFDFVGLLTSKN